MWYIPCCIRLKSCSAEGDTITTQGNLDYLPVFRQYLSFDPNPMVLHTDIHPAGPVILKIVVTTVHVLSISLTCFRLWYRTWRSQLWWEDFWAGIALVAETISLISQWFILNHTGRIIAYWLLIITFTVCLWSARLSIICSIVRLAPRGWKLRKMAIVSAALFIIMFLSLLLQKIYHCAHDTWWYTLEPINCRMGTAIGASQLSTDATSDILLVILPIQLVREGSVPRDQRILLLSVFSSSILISLISAVHFVFMIEPDAYFQIITAHVEIALSVIVCDLLVIVTCVYKLLRRKELGFAQGSTAPTSRTVCFTTIVDLSGLGSREEWPSAENDRKPTPQNISNEGTVSHCEGNTTALVELIS